MTTSRTPRIGVIGLGYVGTPLLAAFAARYETLGFDISAERVAELERGQDSTGELNEAERRRVRDLAITDNPDQLAECNVYIVTVPTPVTDDRRPDLGPLEAACNAVGPLLKPGDTVIFESTVYPGATEEVCVPILETLSGLRGKEDFWYGYSPERMNPGDRNHRLKDIVKVTSGCCEHSGRFIDELYASIVEAGTHRAPSVRVAEAAKVIENTQRDVNIALINELAMLFERLGLDTHAVLEAARTKWNFLPFTPGLVGGHCIGVDPYYLTHKAREIGYDPAMILAGRRINDGMAGFVAGRVKELLRGRGIEADGARVLVMGLTFKENCPDTRNSQVFRLIAELQQAGSDVEVLDPWVDPEHGHGVRLVEEIEDGRYDAIIVAVAHRQFMQLDPATIRGWGRAGAVVYDVKNVLGEHADARL